MAGGHGCNLERVEQVIQVSCRIVCHIRLHGWGTGQIQLPGHELAVRWIRRDNSDAPKPVSIPFRMASENQGYERASQNAWSYKSCRTWSLVGQAIFHRRRTDAREGIYSGQGRR